MALRAIGTVTLGAAPQPVWGTALAAATPIPAPDPYTNSYAPGSELGSVTVQVASTRGFIVGDPVIVRPTTIDATHPSEVGFVTKIVDATHMNIANLTLSHASGQWVINNSMVGRIVIQADTANTALLLLGDESTVAAADPALIYNIGAPASATVTPPEYVLGSDLQNNCINLGQFWITGTTGQKYLPYAFQL